MLAGAAAWLACLAGTAPAAVAESVQSQQWYLKPMKAAEMWKVSTGKGVKVAVVDTGVDPSSPTLRGRVLPGKDLSGAPGGADKDDSGHGTTMAELIAGTGKGGGIKGLAPGAGIIPFRGTLEGVKGADGAIQRTYRAIRAAADSDARIINLSFEGPDYIQLQNAVKYAAGKGKLVFASVGNNARQGNAETYPAAYPEVVGIGAIKKNAKVAEFSNHGDHTDLTAPGEDIPRRCGTAHAAYCGGGGGTSAATALASASAALVWARHPEWTANQVLRVLIDTAGSTVKSRSPSKYIGYGSVRPRAVLLDGKGDPGDPDVSPLTNKRTGKAPTGKSSSASSFSAGNSAPEKVKVADSGSDDGSGNGLLAGFGIGGGVLVLAACGFAVMRRRSR